MLEIGYTFIISWVPAWCDEYEANNPFPRNPQHEQNQDHQNVNEQINNSIYFINITDHTNDELQKIIVPISISLFANVFIAFNSLIIFCFVSANDLIVEIGPGAGALTKELVKNIINIK